MGNIFDNDLTNDPYYYGFVYDVGFRGSRLDELLRNSVVGKDATLEHAQTPSTRSKEPPQVTGYPLFSRFSTQSSQSCHPRAYFCCHRSCSRHGKTSGERFEPAFFYTSWNIFLHNILLGKLFLFEISDFQLLTRTALYWLDRTCNTILQIEEDGMPFSSLLGITQYDRLDTPNRYKITLLRIGISESSIPGIRS